MTTCWESETLSIYPHSNLPNLPTYGSCLLFHVDFWTNACFCWLNQLCVRFIFIFSRFCYIYYCLSQQDDWNWSINIDEYFHYHSEFWHSGKNNIGNVLRRIHGCLCLYLLDFYIPYMIITSTLETIIPYNFLFSCLFSLVNTGGQHLTHYSVSKVFFSPHPWVIIFCTCTFYRIDVPTSQWNDTCGYNHNFLVVFRRKYTYICIDQK